MHKVQLISLESQNDALVSHAVPPSPCRTMQQNPLVFNNMMHPPLLPPTSNRCTVPPGLYTPHTYPMVFAGNRLQLVGKLVGSRRRRSPRLSGHAIRGLVGTSQQGQNNLGKEQKGAERLTRTCLALHTLHASFLTFPSAGTTPGANSTPNM